MRCRDRAVYLLYMTLMICGHHNLLTNFSIARWTLYSTCRPQSEFLIWRHVCRYSWNHIHCLYVFYKKQVSARLGTLQVWFLNVKAGQAGIGRMNFRGELVVFSKTNGMFITSYIHNMDHVASLYVKKRCSRNTV